MPHSVDSAKNSVCVVGLGNPLRGDDALGPVALEYARAMLERGPELFGVAAWHWLGVLRSGRIHLESDPGDPARILDLLEAHSGVVFLDAADMGEEPGTIKIFSDLAKWTRIHLPTSVHGITVQDLLPLAERMGIRPEIRLVAVQAGHWTASAPASPWLDDSARAAAKTALVEAVALLHSSHRMSHSNRSVLSDRVRPIA